MRSKPDELFQFKVTLQGVRPPVWRRIQVPANGTFWDLHVAIQDSMGWQDCHLHQFEVFNAGKGRVELVGIPDDEYPSGQDTLPGWSVRLRRYFTRGIREGLYLYDFGDGWEHRVLLEKSVSKEPGQEYPRCVAGRRRCPPEDCGGVGGYAELLKAISDRRHPEHESMLEWAGGRFDPEEFDPADVEFDDPNERLKTVLEDD